MWLLKCVHCMIISGWYVDYNYMNIILDIFTLRICNMSVVWKRNAMYY